MSAAPDSRDGLEINGVAHVIFRVKPFLCEIDADIVRAPVEGPWAPG